MELKLWADLNEIGGYLELSSQRHKPNTAVIPYGFSRRRYDFTRPRTDFARPLDGFTRPRDDFLLLRLIVDTTSYDNFTCI